MSRNNSSNRNSREADIRREMRMTVEQMRDTRMVMHNRTQRVKRTVYRDLNPVSQLLPRVCDEFTENGLVMEPSENRPSIALPEEYFKFNSAETSNLLSILLDSNHTRMQRLLNQVHIRAMLREDRYYQIVDDPSLYFRSKCTDLPAFHNRVVLYLTTPGVLIYLKQTDALSLFASARSQGVLPRTCKMITRRELRQSKRQQPQSDFASVLAYERQKKERMTPFINVDAYQYATYVHCYDGDILRFQLDFLAVKRNFQEALPILMDMNWHPNCPSTLLYRRRYYQYVTPFLDWVDMMRYQMKTASNIPVTGFYERLLDTDSEYVDIDDLKYLGDTMLECIELRRLNKINCSDLNLHGLYAGRMVYRDKEPRYHNSLRKVFGGNGGVVRPVLPHACSPMRRFLVHLNYYDRQTMTSMPQILVLVEFLLQQEFFSLHPICRVSGIRFEPLVFQIYDFVWSIRQGYVRDSIFLRNEPWDSIKLSEDALAWYRRWDVFNCICLLFSILQNAIENDVDEQLVERLVRIIIDVLRSSEYLECFLSYSYFDTYLGLSSSVNCVPNLSLSCLLRVLHTVPFHLCGTMKVNQVLDSFSDRFWRTGRPAASAADTDAGGGASTERPRSLRGISEFLMTRARRASVRQAPITDNSDAVSGMSAIGTTGAVVLFCRDFDAMPTISPVEEAEAVNEDRLDAMRRVFDERQHLADYRQKEIDYRYGQLFTDSYYMATGRPRIFYDESMTYQDCRAVSMTPFSCERNDGDSRPTSQ